MITCHISVRNFDSCRGKYRGGGNLVTPDCLLLTLSLGLHQQVVVGFVSPSVRDLFAVFSDCTFRSDVYRDLCACSMVKNICLKWVMQHGVNSWGNVGEF